MRISAEYRQLILISRKLTGLQIFSAYIQRNGHKSDHFLRITDCIYLGKDFPKENNYEGNHNNLNNETQNPGIAKNQKVNPLT